MLRCKPRSGGKLSKSITCHAGFVEHNVLSNHLYASNTNYSMQLPAMKSGWNCQWPCHADLLMTAASPFAKKNTIKRQWFQSFEMWHSLPLRMIFCIFNLCDGTAIDLYGHVWSCMKVDLHESGDHRYHRLRPLYHQTPWLKFVALTSDMPPAWGLLPADQEKSWFEDHMTCPPSWATHQQNRTGARWLACTSCLIENKDLIFLMPKVTIFMFWLYSQNRVQPGFYGKLCYLILFSSKTKYRAFIGLFCGTVTYVWNMLCPKEVWRSYAFNEHPSFLMTNVISSTSSVVVAGVLRCSAPAALARKMRPSMEDTSVASSKSFPRTTRRCSQMEISVFSFEHAKLHATTVEILLRHLKLTRNSIWSCIVSMFFHTKKKSQQAPQGPTFGVSKAWVKFINTKEHN